MKQCLAWGATLLSLAASAAVTPLPGATPQAVNQREHFAPIRLLVTDEAGRPAAGALVTYDISPVANVFFDEPGHCRFDLGFHCVVVADQNGVAELFAMSAGTGHGTTSFVAWSIGQATIELTVLPNPATVRLEAVRGNGSRFIAGSLYSSPFAVQAVRPDGRPLPGATVLFMTPSSGVRGTFADTSSLAYARGTTDMNGYAQSPDFTAGWGIGEAVIQAYIGDPETSDFATFDFQFAITDANGRTDVSFQDLWWGGPSESGWGAMVAQHGNRLFNTFFVYDSEGNPTWYVQTTGAWTEGLGSTFSAVAFSPRGSPYYAYDASRFSIGQPLTYGSFPFLSFHGPDTGALVTNLANPQTVKSLARLDFSPDVPAANKGIADLWWGGIEQNGWGIDIMENGGNLFAVWFTYDESGKPVWFPMEAGSWIDEKTYRGTIYRVRGSPWPVGYDASKLRITSTGTFSFHIEDLQHITFEYSFEGHSGSMRLTRLDF